jgi:type VI protein secretion system component Hcp
METTTQIYLQITLERGGAVEGDTQAGGYENRIDIDSFQFNASAKKLSLKDVSDKKVRNNLDITRVTISKVFDRASLQLAGIMKRRERFSEAKIAVDQQFIDPAWSGKVRNETLILYLYSGYVANIKLRTSEANAGAQVKEDIELSFHDFRVEYYAEDRGNSGRLVDDYRWEPCIYETSRPEQEA